MRSLFAPGWEGRVADFLTKNRRRYTLVASPRLIGRLYYLERDNPEAFASGLPIVSIDSLSRLAINLPSEREGAPAPADRVHVVADPDGEGERVAQLRALHPELTFVGLCRDLVPALQAMAAHRVTEPLGELPMPERLTVILATARSGSSYVADILAEMGLGDAREHLRSTVVDLWTSDYAFDRKEALRNFLRLSARDGRCATKLITHFVQDFVAAGGSIMEVAAALEGVRARFVVLDREDRVAQAVSDYIATQRGVWHAFEGRELKAPAGAAIDYSFAPIFSRYVFYTSQGDHLRLWARLLGDVPILTYEADVDGRPVRQVAARLAELADHPNAPLPDSLGSGRRRIASDLNDRLIAAFEADLARMFPATAPREAPRADSSA